ncbi:acyl-CoA dehydrogenase family protein [Paenibacillus melissococcoides]|uniref:Acyl-CoA dehydrogenase family protein n=1 Tax=Paenibacillus melissococcoides TaxID=2912268 RepID=A0ABM9G7Z9_9BACL|nr:MULTISPECIES: acyl-CoA dehydrogenase family protein [Paenibacillus]MEB9892562.1 acyl-CoA dehydrogenase family protein [Bacillus cereus]CAH8247893.1 acyl-CoA dehydrogenase family protein [Paenibacillus melissococcoides]CAH8719228.1 acyl-CoA dehydrogenase family protein [Paenibacillus melissococcoides]CAH8720239.1 acyl-CoA dehydrogenase family protein [Paenibacillus melissococcoides]GIO78821.1 acyl-CoA dehydrogenase [Paenibacillus dendritiformis]
MTVLDQKVKGGSFVIDDIAPDAIVTPEDFTEEQRMMMDTTRDYVEGEVLPNDEAIEKLNYDLTVKLMRKAGELGLLGADIPEEYGGLGLDKVSSTLIGETLTKASAFALSIGAHVGIGTLPIVFFGTPEQKSKYLPDLATGAKIAAYCLTEPSSGSDALSAKTTAKLSEDGSHYVLNGSKIFITNAGFADIFIVYAKVDGKDFTAFIVEKGMEGFTIGPEEKKMGIKGSSTCPLFFEDVKVPVENVLGEIGRGHVIAFNILNIGRFKLGAGCLGASKEAIELSVKYANERKQFGKALTSFPLIGQKLADMNIATYVTESMVYRTSGLVDSALKDIDYRQPDSGQLMAKAIAEYALECSINKVFASEALDFVADEGVQIHGGYGFTQEYKIERIYRDSRINRIFEGTNEINRLLIPGMLLKKAAKGELPLMQKAQALQAELMSIVTMPDSGEALALEGHLVSMSKKVFLMAGGLAAQKYGTSLEQQQEILSNLADLMILVYAMESALLRTRKLMAKSGEEKAKLAMQMTSVYVHETLADIERIAKSTLAAMESGDMLRTQLSILKKLTKSSPIDAISIKRDIAARVIQAEKYAVS